MNDLAKRLRESAKCLPRKDIKYEAADRIEQLQARVDKLEVVKDAAQEYVNMFAGTYDKAAKPLRQALAALEEQSNE